ncbi:Alpha-1,3-mannosyltransferase [Lachnellula occidentalis]|uniref:Alpha-1,3-mannosyltransferase n=1 Tax=Lachnellula occidentalis TaxID=215460 RepID=A0A8H8SAM3_9HELO|nr:Alpha-1,3-mannosyltransferase [Lachnellula occidentalis]
MLFHFLRRSFRPRLLLLALITFIFLDYLLCTSAAPGPKRTSELSAPLAREQIFIVSIQRNSEYMLRLYWNAALLSLVSFLGPQNVFVSILESGSLDDTKGALRDLEQALNDLGAENRIVLGETQEEQIAGQKHVPVDRDGWLYTGREGFGDGGWEKRRIPHLAKLRNNAMEPLFLVKRKFDKVLWVNDVVFTNEDVATLLSTREGNYAAACAMDFSSDAAAYYDTFALRDSSGLKTGSIYYPYFLSRPSLQSLLSLQPIPVQSCWNGLVSFAAASFYTYPQLKFRGISDSLAGEHLEGSECCLIHSDNHVLRDSKGVWMNPNVRVTYNASTYVRVNPQGPLPESISGDEKMQGVIEEVKGGSWPGKWERWTGTWENRRARWFRQIRFWSENKVVETRVKKWASQGREKGEEREERGLECLINEMQVMLESGWQHV